MPETQSIGLAVAFAAGLLSFLSPCVLPLIPSYVTFITGMSLDDLTDRAGRRRGQDAVRLANQVDPVEIVPPELLLSNADRYQRAQASAQIYQSSRLQRREGGKGGRE